MKKYSITRKKMSFQKKSQLIAIGIVAILALFLLYQFYIPKLPKGSPTLVYTVKKGMTDSDIATDLQTQGLIKSSLFFKMYVMMFGGNAKLQAGKYNVSSSLSIAKIADTLRKGQVIKDTVTIPEGWDIIDIAKYLDRKEVFSQQEFLVATKNDFTSEFTILKDKPKKLGLEGYIFPDTYQISGQETPQEFLENMLSNANKKFTPELLSEIATQKKSVFEIITMASIIEKEVKSIEDKKVVSGILWKRIDSGMPLQVDATINYITQKNDPSVTIKDTTIDSPYNTYKYAGLPAGPISNPGMDSILAAIYPKTSQYWFYLSADGTGKTIFSKTLADHLSAIQKYLQ